MSGKCGDLILALVITAILVVLGNGYPTKTTYVNVSLDDFSSVRASITTGTIYEDDYVVLEPPLGPAEHSVVTTVDLISAQQLQVNTGTKWAIEWAEENIHLFYPHRLETLEVPSECYAKITVDGVVVWERERK